MDLIKSFVGPISTNALKDTAKLVIIGSTVEATRRAATNGWKSFVDSFFLTAHFSQDDYPYDWIMHWLAKQPSYASSREFDVGSARSSGTMTATHDIDDDGGVDPPPGVRRTPIQFLPSYDTQHSIFYRGHWLKITRARRGTHGYAELKISVVARNNNILKQLVLQARREYEADMEHRVHIFIAESTSWRWNGAQKKRPLSSVVLEPGIKDMLIADARDFLASEAWYADRGIPYRRGYLLHGVPGSGKTSLIHAIAGELSLDIYVVSLSAKGMSDNTLTSLLGRVPSRCILLLEDLDAAFTKSVTRDAKSTGVPIVATAATATAAVTLPAPASASDDPNTLSLSGLLNSLDGVAASTGRLLFATTNHYERLDAALTRPGRLDVHVDFKHASKWQAEGIFKNFYPILAKDEEPVIDESTNGTSTPVSEKPKSTIVPPNVIIPIMEEEELAELAKRFAAAIPEGELSVAGLQGYLLRNKTRPREAVAEVEAWVENEREARVKLKKLKEEEEAKKLELEKAAKEKAEKDAVDAAAKAKVDAATAASSDIKKKRSSRKTVAKPSEAASSAKAEVVESDAESESETPSAASTLVDSSSSEAGVAAPHVVAVPASKAAVVKAKKADSSEATEVDPSSSAESTPLPTSSSSSEAADDSANTTSDEAELDQSVVLTAAGTSDADASSKWVSVKVPAIETVVVTNQDAENATP